MSPVTTIKACMLATNQQLHLVVATKPNPNTLAIAEISCRVVQATPKTLRIELDTRHGCRPRFWLPRRALVNLEHDGAKIIARLASWFSPSEAQSRAIHAQADAIRSNADPRP